ncbi:MAG: cytochrome c [Nitrospira sp.]|jgi:mono/diheme cytochrome c family protein|nr:MAG: cytochrome c [Nitrospira sp.]
MEAVRPVVDKEGMTGGITGVEDPAEVSNTSIEHRESLSVLERRGAHMSLRIVVSLIVVALTASWALAQSHYGNTKNGERIFQQHCAGCHGTTGDGLGPEIKELIVPPANFRAPKSRTKTDMELYLAVKQGVLFSPMHGWADRLSNQDMWDVLSYIRTLAPFNPLG